MPGISGLQLQEELARLGSTLPIIFLTGNGDVRSSVRAMKEGAIDFLTKPVNDEELLAAIQRALAHNLQARQQNADQSQIREKVARLTPREHEVLIHIVAGKLNKQVAADLGTVEKTIKVHRARIMEKLEVDSLADLVRLVEKAGIQPAK
jgi:FixJ family two-component response regulator